MQSREDRAVQGKPSKAGTQGRTGEGRQCRSEKAEQGRYTGQGRHTGQGRQARQTDKGWAGKARQTRQCKQAG
jgi:hypothetical protein